MADTQHESDTDNPFLKRIYSRANCLHPKAFFIRLDGRCNQDCDFCNILEEGGSTFSLSPGHVKRVLRQIAGLKPTDAVVNFTGGEPTLRRDLPMLVAYAKHVGVQRVVLQTNAIRMRDPVYVDALMRAGLDDALISFHSHLPEISDEMTRAPGTWERTRQGIQVALEAGLDVSLNLVVTRDNLSTVVDSAGYILKEFPGISGVILSPVQPHGRTLLRLDKVPTFTELTQPIRQSAELLMGAGVPFYLSYCENPLCWLLDTFDIRPSTEVRRYIVSRLKANTCGDCHLSTVMDKDKVKAEACEVCYMQDVCFGLWRRYQIHLGHDELRPAPFPEGGRRLRQAFSHAPYTRDPEKYFAAGAAFRGVPIAGGKS